MSRAGQQAVQWHMVMVYLTCADIGLGGRGVIKTWTEVAARVRLYMLTSDLTSLVPPQFSHLAASEESWHRSVFFCFFFIVSHVSKKLWNGTKRSIVMIQMKLAKID